MIHHGISIVGGVLVIGYVWLMVIVSCHGQTMENEETLYDDIMTGYRKHIRPSWPDRNTPLEVQIEFDLLSIREVDAIVGKVSIIGIVYLRWIDQRISWNPYLHNGTFMLNIPQEHVWKPDLIVGYAVDEVHAIGYDHKWVNVRYFYNGTAKYAPADVLNAACSIDVAFYPYDTQVCNIFFLPWGMLSNEIIFYSPRTSVYKRYYTEHGEWALDSATTRTELMYELYPSLILEMRFTRRSTFVIVNVILPIMFMGIINILVFWLPPQSGERVSFAMTVLLAIAVFLTLVVENLPKTSQPMSTVCYFLLTNLVLSSLIMIMTIMNLAVYHRKEEKPKSRWHLFLVALFAKRNRKEDRVVKLKQERDIEVINVSELDTELKQVHGRGKGVPENSTKRQISWDTQSDDVSRNEKMASWKDVSTAMDKLCTILAGIWLVGSVVAFFVMVATQQVPGMSSD